MNGSGHNETQQPTHVFVKKFLLGDMPGDGNGGLAEPEPTTMDWQTKISFVLYRMSLDMQQMQRYGCPGLQKLTRWYWRVIGACGVLSGLCALVALVFAGIRVFGKG